MSQSSRIVVYGAGGHAKVVIDAIQQSGFYETISIVDDCKDLLGKKILGCEVVGGRQWLDNLTGKKQDSIVAVGDNVARLRMSQWLQDNDFSLATIIHPSVQLGRNVKIGAGSFLAAGVVVNPDVTIGRNVIINTSASIDHDCWISDNVHVAPGCHLCGNVSVEAGSLLGVGTSVVPEINLGKGVITGAGSTVTQDVADDTTVAGVPAKPIRFCNE